MKPLNLEFTAFGSYPDTETVNFESLTELGLYVVTGPTGSGKTTIFDAMAYALYGEVPGVRDKGDVRSQHAHADATCSVVLRFEIDGEVYRVERTPEQYKPRQRGGDKPVKVTAKASLVRESDDFPLESGATKVSKYCIGLVGLDKEQFERVVLLPQGQFQEFLLANTATRQPLLRQLFGTGKWQTVIEELKSKASDAKGVVAEIEAQLREHQFAIGGALQAADDLLPDIEEQPLDGESPDEQSLDELASRLEALATRTAPLREDERQLKDAANAAIAAHAEAVAIIDSWDKRVELCEDRRLLDEQASQFVESRSNRDAARKAEPVLNAAAIQDRDAMVSSEAQSALNDCAVQLGVASVEAQIGEHPDPDADPDAAADALVVARSKNDGQRTALTNLAVATTLLVQLEEKKANLEAERATGTQRIDDINAFLVPGQSDKIVLEVLAASELECRIKVDKAQDLLRQREELVTLGTLIPEAQSVQDEALAVQRVAIKAFDDSAAPRLAESLISGEACPVCGSHEHPAPAASVGDQQVDSETRDSAAQAVMDATQELLRLGNRQAELVSSLGDVATKPVEEVAAQHELATAEHAAADEAGTKVKALIVEIETAEAKKAVIVDRGSEIDLELAGIEPQISAAVVQRDALRAEAGELAACWDVDPQEAIDALDAIAAALDQVERCITNCREASQTVTKTQATARASASTLAEALAASLFTSVVEAQAVALDPDELARLEATIVDFDTRDSANQTLLSENLKLVLPEERPDATELDASAQAARTAAEKASATVSKITGHLDLARGNLKAAQEIDGGSSDAFERSNSLQRLAKTYDGQGPKKIALETWVLAGELERVAAAANFHLSKMTNGRYQIERSDDSGHGGKQAGLDLRVLDAHTGASRRPGSLSGGEQFQASLALALGLADVIGHGGNANGRVFEALFVDEGFGSLDPDSLQQAVDALSHIQAGGRTVGVITHVEAMKEQLAIGIRVNHLPTGKGSTLTVYPKN